MATKVKRQRTVHYKLVKMNPNKSNLQELLRNTLNKAPKPKDRMELLGENNNLNRFINTKRNQDGMIFGEMVLYEPGRDQAIIVLDDLQDEFPIENLPIPQRTDGKNQEFLDSILYFGILENHVVLLQSKSMRSRDFENHLLWLLNELTSSLPEGTEFYLSDQPTQEAKNQIEKMPIKKIKIGTPVVADGKIGPETKTSMEASTFKYRIGRGMDILAAVMGPDWRKNFKFEDALDEANLRVNLEISYLRKTTQQAYEILENIATSMRHSDPEDVKVELVGGGIINGEDMKLSGKVSVNVINGVIDSSDLFKQMHSWLKSRIEEGTVV